MLFGYCISLFLSMNAVLLGTQASRLRAVWYKLYRYALNIHPKSALFMDEHPLPQIALLFLTSKLSESCRLLRLYEEIGIVCTENQVQNYYLSFITANFRLFFPTSDNLIITKVSKRPTMYAKRDCLTSVKQSLYRTN